MQKKIALRLLPSEAGDSSAILENIARTTGDHLDKITGYNLLRKSIDARGKTIWVNLTLQAFIDEPFHPPVLQQFDFKDVRNSPGRVILIGGGPAGIFAALRLLELGIKPVILERGKPVRDRRRDLALLNREGVLNPESNYCFGEGGAGTYSDGKLYTRSTKRGDMNRILGLFVHFGADERILYEAHPHIGTNKLPHIITEMRSRILDCGGEFHFEKKVTDLVLGKDRILSVKTADGDIFPGDSFILATGHSARDIFTLLAQKNIEIQAKGFALGVRVEHPQELINAVQYGGNYPVPAEGSLLPPASYSVVDQVDGRGVFSFCMCPGGIIAPASTQVQELVVNGWSPSKRNNPFANSGMVVQVEIEDVVKYRLNDKSREVPDLRSPLLMMDFQSEVERRAFDFGGGNFVAPAQRMVDFTEGLLSAALPKCSYVPGISSSLLTEVLPSFVSAKLRTALRSFDKKMPSKRGRGGFFTNEALLVATESRTSSPVRIPRDEQFLHHPRFTNFFPCGEGAGYAGGIMSAAMDGEKVAQAAFSLVSRRHSRS